MESSEQRRNWDPERAASCSNSNNDKYDETQPIFAQNKKMNVSSRYKGSMHYMKRGLLCVYKYQFDCF